MAINGGKLMRVHCKECNKTARITHRDTTSPVFSKLYCSCNDSKCGHSFTMLLTFDRTLSPSSSQTTQLLKDIISNLPEDKQRDLFSSVGCLS